MIQIFSFFCGVLLSQLAFASQFIQVKDTQFSFQGRPLYYMGTNFWYGMNLGSKGPGGNRDRLLRELDRMKLAGITNLRILAGSEGPDSEPWRINPALQKTPGVYDQDLIEGLDFLLDEMRKRDLHAIVMLSNFWPWSGGLTQYRQWTGAGPIPYPEPEPHGDITKYRSYASEFYTDTAAQALLDNFIKFIVNRKNSISGTPYSEDPTIMAWELANEPSVVGDITHYDGWLEREANFIKSLDPNHLVTTGSEGQPPWSDLNLVRDHKPKSIDYVTIHLWAQNWGWYDPMKAALTYPLALSEMKKYFRKMTELTKALHKPMVLEEFGLARDDSSLERGSPTTYRDRYYKAVFEEVYQAVKKGSPVAAVNFWAWGGEGIPAKRDWWQPGDPFMGDPAGEHQGWYSIFDNDLSTIQIISDYAAKLMSLKEGF